MNTAIMSRPRFLRLRLFNIVKAQFGHRIWARRIYRLAVRIDRRPVTYTRIETEGVRMLVAEQRFGPTLHNVQVMEGAGYVTGSLTRNNLSPSDLSNACIRIEQPEASNWGFQSLYVGMVSP